MKNKKKKQLPLLLLALLFITAAAYGTRAYFTDNASQNADIKLTLGNLDIESNTKEWVYVGEGNPTAGLIKDSTITSAEVTYVQPGDIFTRTFIFKNVGSLNQKVKLTNPIENLQQNENNPFTVEVSAVKDAINLNSPDGNYILKPNQAIEFTVAINVDYDNVGNEFNLNHSDSKQDSIDDVTLDYLTTNVLVEAVQTN